MSHAWGNGGGSEEELSMTPEEAHQRLQAGGFVLCLDVPPETEFGCDFITWNVGAKFQGLKMIPPGIHLILVGTGHGSRCGEFVKVSAGEVVVRRWDPALEDFAPGCGVPEDQRERFVSGVRSNEFDASMGPYPQKVEKLWTALAGHINEAVLERALVPCGVRVVAGDPDAEDARDAQAAGTVVPHFEGVARAARFTALWPTGSTAPKGKKGTHTRHLQGMTPEQITQFNLDASARLTGLIQSHYGGDWRLLLGEFQLAFVLFAMLHSMAGFSQWKDLLVLCCSCDAAIAQHPEFFHHFVQVVRHHLEHVPQDFFVDELAADNFLRPLLGRLCANVRAHVALGAGPSPAEAAPGAAPPPGSHATHLEHMKTLSKRTAALQKFVAREFDLDLKQELEDEEDAPVVVGVTEADCPPSAMIEDDPSTVPEGSWMVLTEDGPLESPSTKDKIAPDGKSMELGEEVVVPSGAPVERMGWMMQ